MKHLCLYLCLFSFSLKAFAQAHQTEATFPTESSPPLQEKKVNLLIPPSSLFLGARVLGEFKVQEKFTLGPVLQFRRGLGTFRGQTRQSYDWSLRNNGTTYRDANQGGWMDVEREIPRSYTLGALAKYYFSDYAFRDSFYGQVLAAARYYEFRERPENDGPGALLEMTVGYHWFFESGFNVNFGLGAEYEPKSLFPWFPSIELNIGRLL